MKTRSVDYYANLIAQGFSKPIYNSRIAPDGKGHAKLIYIEDKDVDLKLVKGIKKAVLQYRLENRIVKDKFFQRQGTHNNCMLDLLIILKDIKEHEAPKIELINKFKNEMEKGVINQKCSLKGNYANFCRAVIDSTRDYSAWKFSSELIDKLNNTDNHTSFISFKR